MKEKPKRREEPILTGGMLRRIFATGGYTLALCLVFLKSGAFRAHFRPETGDAVFLTAFYVLFIFAGIFNCFNARSERLRLFDGITRNRAFLFVMASISVIQILMVYFGGSLFRTVPLSPSEFFMVVLLAASVIPFDFLRRVFVRLI